MRLLSVQSGRLAVAVGCLLAMSAGCGSKLGGGAPAPDVWAVVDDYQIHEDDVLKTWRREAQAPPTSTTDTSALLAQLSVVDEMITQQVLIAQAPALKLSVTDAEVDAAYAARKANVPEEQFRLALSERSLTADDLRAGFRRELLAQKVLDHDVVPRIDVSDRDIEAFFSSHRAQFNLAEPQYHIAQIVITPVRDAETRNRKNDDATTPEAATRKFEMIASQLKAGADFATLAADYSEDAQSAPQGGDLGFISASQLAKVPAQLRDLVLKTEPGRVSSVAVAGGYTLVAVLAREPAGQRELDSPGVRDTIRTSLHDGQEQLLRAADVTMRRNNARIVNYFAQRIAEAPVKPPAMAPSTPGR